MTDQKIKLAKLHEYKSQGGQTYFRGFLDQNVVLVLKDHNAETPNGAVAVTAPRL